MTNANQTKTASAATLDSTSHFLFCDAREMVYRVTGEDEVTIYAGYTKFVRGGNCQTFTRTVAEARAHYKSLVAQGWTSGGSVTRAA